jgi:hypothetical protein
MNHPRRTTLITLITLTTFCIAALLGLALPARAAAPIWPAIDPKLPTLWIIGDSTVRNGTLGDGANGQWGWGNPIASFFDPTKINVQNRAFGGTSSRTFYTTPTDWPAILPLIKTGDFLIMQFGHNDGGSIAARASLKSNGEETQTAPGGEVVHSYGWYLRKYASEARERGAAMSIICSPIPRNHWANGRIGPDSYAPIAQAAARQDGLGYIDLNALIIKKYEALGQPKVTDELFPVDEATHTSWAGALLNAQCVIEGLKALEQCPIVPYLLPHPPADLKNPTGKPR